MTAFDSTLVAISLKEGRYEVVSQINAQLNSKALEAAGFLHDTSENSSYIDEAAILHKNQLPEYLLPRPSTYHPDVHAWHQALPNDVFFIIVHLAQFESGLGD